MIGAGNIAQLPMTVPPAPPQGSRLLSRVLPVAVKLWLQTQLDDIGDLTFEIQATDRQVLSGNIPGISLSAQQAVYQGVCITDVTVQASTIAINIGQVIRGKPLRLKQAFPIEGYVAFDGASLAVSSTNSVLADGLLDFWQTLLAKEQVATEVERHYGRELAALQDPQLSQYQSRLEILGPDIGLHLVRQQQSEIILKSRLRVEQGHVLQLTNARWCLPSGDQIHSEALNDFCWDLGEQVDVSQLSITNGQLTCHCKIMIQP